METDKMKGPIRVLTMWEPWATLLVYGIKLYETRPKPTTHRGTYLIHTAKRWGKEQISACFDNSDFLEECGINSPKDFSLGCIIGSATITGCMEMYNNRFALNNPDWETTINIASISLSELNMGDWKVGRYAWSFEDRKVFITPLPYKGGQGYYQKFRGTVIPN